MADYNIIQVYYYNSMYVIVVIIVVLLSVINVTTTGISVIGENYSVVCIVDAFGHCYYCQDWKKVWLQMVTKFMRSVYDSVSISYTSLKTSHSG